MAQTTTRGPAVTTDRDSIMKWDALRRRAYRQEPANAAPTYKILKQLQSRSSVDKRTEVQWARYPYDARYGDVLDVYTDVLSSAYTTGGAKGDVLYVALSEDDAKQMVERQILFLNSAASPGTFIAGQIQKVNVGADTTSYVTIKLLEADTDDMLAETDLDWYIGGNAQEEFSGLPHGIRKEPVWSSNIMQLFMGSCGISGTELAEQRAGAEVLETPGWTEDQRRLRREMMEEFEWSILFGRYSKSTGANNRPMWFMRGLVSAIAEEQSTHIFNYKTDETYDDTTWASGGWTWLKDVMHQISRYGSHETFQMWVGDLAQKAITDLIESKGTFNMEPLENSFGIRVRRLYGFQSTIDMYQHPIFATRPALRKCAFIYVPSLVQYVHLPGRDFQVVGQAGSNTIDNLRSEGHTWIDGKLQGFMAQFTLRYDGLENMAFMKNIGEDNPA